MLKITKNVELKNLSTMKIGAGFADLYEIESLEDFEKLVEQEKASDFFLLGSGTNTIFLSVDFHQKILKINIFSIEIFNETMKVGAGANWDDFVQKYMELGGTNMESLSMIPGTVGAAPMQNIGAYGHDVGEFIESVEVYDKLENKFKIIKSLDCKFTYRSSIFKLQKNRYIVLFVNFRIIKKTVEIPQYKDVKNFFLNKNKITDATELWKESTGKLPEKVTTLEIREAIIFIRNLKFPDVNEIPNCGSFFENPIISKETLSKVQEYYPEIPIFPVGGMKTENGLEGRFVKIPLAYIIEKLGYKGKQIGNFSMYKNHALLLTNVNNGDVEEFREFIEKLKSNIFIKVGIEIKEEVNIV